MFVYVGQVKYLIGSGFQLYYVTLLEHILRNEIKE